MIPWSYIYLMWLVMATRGSARDDINLYHDQQPDNTAFVWGRISNMCHTSISDERYDGDIYSTLRNASSGNKPAHTVVNRIDWNDCDEMADKDFPSLTFTIIEDTPVPRECDNRALLSLPPGLVVKESGISGAGKGVWTEKFLPAGVRLGPYGGETHFYDSKSSQSGYSWIIKCGGEKIYFVDAENERRSNWMRYINMARKESEQNIKSYQYLGQIYYYTYKPIQPGTELLEYYGFEYGKLLGINMEEYFSDSDDCLSEFQHGLVPIPDIDWDACDDTESEGYPTEPLIIVEDNPLPDNCHNRAKRSVPPGTGLVVKESGIPGAGLGVWTEKFIPAGVRFGPYRGDTYLYDQKGASSSGYAWTIYCGRKKVYFRDAENERTSNWVRYVNMSRNKKEENIMYYQHGGHVYYRTFKPIPPDTELLVFYGYSYAEHLGIDMDKYNSVDENSNEDDNIS